MEKYLETITLEESDAKISPALQKIVGAVKLPENFDEAQELRDYLEHKHLWKAFFVDTNILVDLIGDRKPFSKFAIEIFNQAEAKNLRLFTQDNLSSLLAGHTVRELITQGKSSAKAHIAVVMCTHRNVPGGDKAQTAHIFLIGVDHKACP